MKTVFDIKYPATFRELLDHYDFDWKSGRIILQKAAMRFPAHATKPYFKGTVEIAHDDPVLDLRQKLGAPGGSMPRLVAYDEKRIYFPEAYECCDTMIVVEKFPEAYLADCNLPTPYFRHWVPTCPTIQAGNDWRLKWKPLVDSTK